MCPNWCNTGDDVMAPDNRGKAMGDMADHFNDSQGYWGVDDWDDDYYSPPKRTLKCNQCGSKDVYWKQVPSGKWCLHTDGKPHTCRIGV